MDDKKKRKIGIAAIAVPAMTVGTVALVSAYQADNSFQPFASNRELQKNQVVFSEDDGAVGEEKKSQGDESEYWKKNENSGQDKSPSPGEQDGKYLFEKGLLDQNDMTQNDVAVLGDTTAGIVQEQQTGSNATASGQPVYRLTDDKGKADTIIHGNGTGIKQDTAGANGDSDKNGGTSDKKESDSSENENKKDDPLIPNPTPTPTPTPDKVYPADKVEDTESNKAMPDTSVYGKDKVYNYTENAKEDLNNPENKKRIIIRKGVSNSESALYKGQIVDKKRIFNALETFAYVLDSKGNEKFYVWGSSAQDMYVRIEEVSFDDGKTWTDVFPLTIPTDSENGQMLIRVGYRFSANDTSWMQEEISYDLEDSRVYLLSEALTDEHQTLDTKKILNSDQYLAEGEKVNLLRYQWMYLGEERLKTVFPGWSEKGKKADWFYPVTVGRHILEPEDSVALDPAYTVYLRQVWMSEDLEVSPEYSNLCYLQALTDVDDSALTGSGDNDTRLQVPEYIQAVMMDDDADVSVDYLDIPDTVFYISDSSNGLKVQKGYSVDENNPCYAVADDGILTNKAGTEYLNIPYEREKVTVKEGVVKVAVSPANEIRTLQLEATSVETMPAIDYGKLENCKILVREDLLEDFIKENWAKLKKNPGNSVAAISDPSHAYRMKYGCLIDQNGSLRRVLDVEGSKVQLAAEITNIEEGALDKAQKITTLLLTKSGETIHLEENCFRNSGLKKILCYTQIQYRTIIDQLPGTGAAEEIEVVLLDTSKEGYTYTVEEKEGQKEVTLVSVPANLQSFDGTMTDKEGNLLEITAIDEYAFSESEQLEWVVLPENIKKIGYEAFWNCPSLQGIMIESRDHIEIGNKAFDDCASLRFVASNAMEAVMDDDYIPTITDSYRNHTFYIPTGSDGYNGGLFFEAASGVCSYQLVEIGETGKALYGNDAEGSPWLLLRTGGKVDREVSLPDTTIEIWSQSMEYTKTANGENGYTVNWGDLGQLYIDSGAFYGSELAGNVELKDGAYVASYAMYNCKQITAVTMGNGIQIIGEGAFGGCSSLQTVELGTMKDTVAIYSGLFNGCNQLTDVTIHDYNAPNLISYNRIKFQLNFDWSKEEEMTRLRIHVPSWSETDYIKAWRYFYAGAVASFDYPAYLNMWYDIRYDNMDPLTWEFPPDEEVDALVEAELLDAENRIRTMFGMERVAEPTSYYPYRLDNEGNLTLVGASSDSEWVNLWYLDNLPEEWYLDYIGTGAFRRAKNLEEVLIPDSLSGIYTNAFEGVESNSLMLLFMGAKPPKLMGWSKENPFVFGAAEDSIHIELWGGEAEDYLKTWIFPMAGYNDLAEMRDGVKEELTAAGTEASDEAVDVEVGKRLLPIENRLRKMFDMEPISKAEELCVTLENLPKEDTDTEEKEEENAGEQIPSSEDQTADLTKKDSTETGDGKEEQASGNGDGQPESGKDSASDEKEAEDITDKKDQNDSAAAPDTDAGIVEEQPERKGNQKNTDTATDSGSGEETQE